LSQRKRVFQDQGRIWGEMKKRKLNSSKKEGEKKHGIKMGTGGKIR